MIPNPFELSVSKPTARRHRPFDRLRANGFGVRFGVGIPFGLSLSKPSWNERP
jgi:hypothetical protein